MTYTQAPTICDECADHVEDDDLAPSCGAHRLHIACAASFSCHWCDLERDHFWEPPC